VIWLLIALGYIAGGFATSIWIARDQYRVLIADPTSGLSEYSDDWYAAQGRRYGKDAWTDDKETARRQRCSKLAAKSGLLWGPFWPVALALFIAGNGWDWLIKTIGRIAASPLEKKRLKEIEYKKAQKIVEEYEKEEKRKWESNFKA
jgi:hypothetical protein